METQLQQKLGNNNENLGGYKELNSLCAYLAMFPSWVPEKYIKKFTKKGDLVFEPFSGRGTTTLEAIKLGRRVYSNDLSPLAFVLTRAKTKPAEINKAINIVRNLEKEYNNWDGEIDYDDPSLSEIKVFYSKKNLRQLYFLREKLGKKWNKKNFSDTKNYILAIALGIAHGPTRKTGDINNSLYFSVSMQNGYSISPTYAEKYIQRHDLHRIETNIFEQIISRIKSKPSEFLPKEGNKVFLGDALKSSHHFIEEKPKLIFTSPPYLNIVRYVEQNWIRFWLLGFEREETRKNMVNDYHAKEEYKKFLAGFMLEMEKIMIPEETVFIMVIGDVRQHKIKELINEIFNEYLSKSKLKLFGRVEPQELKRKTSSQMGSRVGKATDYDWVFKFKRTK